VHVDNVHAQLECLKKEYENIKKKEDFYCTFMKNSQNVFANSAQAISTHHSHNNSKINSGKNTHHIDMLSI